MRRNRLIPALAAFILTCSCNRYAEEASIFPDYRDVTVPCNIAPLNFHYDGVRRALTTFEYESLKFTVRGRKVTIDADKWKDMLDAAAGGDITVSSNVMGSWKIHVSADTIDRYLTYRLIEPGYEVWDRVEICERDISSFEERVISSWKDTDNSCMNCHIHKGSSSMFYLRGPKGGAILNSDGKLRKLNLRTPDMVSSTVYGDLHPEGRWGVFSTNIIIPGFHTGALRRLEVYDTASDLAIADFEGCRMLCPPALADEAKFETFPCFSADGKAIYFCCADTVKVPQDISGLHYSMMKVSFDPESGEVGEPEVLWDGPAHCKSVCHPKASPDGKWLLFTVADYGTFPIWHRECDLAMLNLQTGEMADISEVNSDRSDTYHSWSSNSRWFVFASKRGDGQFGKPYICHVDADGRCSKPFLLPQQDPYYYENSLKSCNIPDLGAVPVSFDRADIAAMRENAEAEVFCNN